MARGPSWPAAAWRRSATAKQRGPDRTSLPQHTLCGALPTPHSRRHTHRQVTYQLVAAGLRNCLLSHRSANLTTGSQLDSPCSQIQPPSHTDMPCLQAAFARRSPFHHALPSGSAGRATGSKPGSPHEHIPRHPSRPGGAKRIPITRPPYPRPLGRRGGDSFHWSGTSTLSAARDTHPRAHAWTVCRSKFHRRCHSPFHGRHR